MGYKIPCVSCVVTNVFPRRASLAAIDLGAMFGAQLDCSAGQTHWAIGQKAYDSWTTHSTSFARAMSSWQHQLSLPIPACQCGGVLLRVAARFRRVFRLEAPVVCYLCHGPRFYS